MGRQLSEKGIEVFKYGINTSYILKDRALFSPGEYRMLRNLDNDCLIRCMKTWFNGADQLIYETGEYSSLSMIFGEVREEAFIRIVENLLTGLKEIEQNTFLSCTKLDISPECIFLDPTSMDIKFIYLPVHDGIYRDCRQFEHMLRLGLIRVMMDRGFISGDVCAPLLCALKDSSVRLSQIKVSGRAQVKEKNQTICLKGTQNADGLVFVIDKDEYVLGRSEFQSDAVISGNKSVGRTHCRFLRRNDGYYVEDLDSVNGTFLNGKRLQKEVGVKVKAGDIIGLSDVTFMITGSQTGS